VKFVVVYQREPHARQLAFRDVLQPKNFEERAALARRTRDELDLDALEGGDGELDLDALEGEDEELDLDALEEEPSE